MVQRIVRRLLRLQGYLEGYTLCIETGEMVSPGVLVQPSPEKSNLYPQGHWRLNAILAKLKRKVIVGTDVR